MVHIKKGYMMLYKPEHPNCWQNGYVYEHIYIMSKHLGRKINTSKENIHHINHNKLDNRIENLKLMTKSEHNALHMREESKNSIKGIFKQKNRYVVKTSVYGNAKYIGCFKTFEEAIIAKKKAEAELW